MLIKSLNSTLINYDKNKANISAKNSTVDFTANSLNPTSQLSYDKIPLSSLTVFKGLPVIPATAKIALPKALERLDGEMYSITLLDRAKQKVQAFLNYKNYKEGTYDYKELGIYDEMKTLLGKVYVDFSEWHSQNISLPRNHVRLHDLETHKKDQYTRVGSTIFQAAVEKSLETEAKGRLYLYGYNPYSSNNDPFVFYRKMGMTIKDPREPQPEVSKYLYDAEKRCTAEEAAHLRKIFDDETVSPDDKILAIYHAISASSGLDLDKIRMGVGEYMFLPDEKVESFWLPKIQAKPIFNPANRLK